MKITLTEAGLVHTAGTTKGTVYEMSEGSFINDEGQVQYASHPRFWTRFDEVKHTPMSIDVADKHTKLEIKTQKLLASEFLTKVRLVSPFAILVGGAPRNWYFNRPANDLDILMTVPDRASHRHLKELLEFLGMTDVYDMATQNPDGSKKTPKETGHTYEERMEGIHSVFEGWYEGQKIQFIFTHESTYGYMESHFDTSINMIYAVPNLKGSMELRWGKDFQDTIDSGCIFVHIGQTNYSGDHLERMSKYFPDSPLIDSAHQKDVMERPELIPFRKESWEVHQRRLYDLMKERKEDEREVDFF